MTTSRFYGERVRALRQQQRLSAARLAAACGITARHIYRVEANQKKHLWATTVLRLAVTLNTTTDYLFGLTDDPQRPPAPAAH